MDKLGSRIMIIGSCGSGKSTLALQLNKITKLPVIHLDKEYWIAGWKEPTKEQWREKQRQIISGETWIADGNYGGSLDIRLKKAETVIFLDFNRYLCTYRVIKRWWTNIGKVRIDMAEGCPEKIDLPFIKFVWRFPMDSRETILTELKKYKDIHIITLTNPKQVKEFLSGLITVYLVF